MDSVFLRHPVDRGERLDRVDSWKTTIVVENNVLTHNELIWELRHSNSNGIDFEGWPFLGHAAFIKIRLKLSLIEYTAKTVFNFSLFTKLPKFKFTIPILKFYAGKL